MDEAIISVYRQLAREYRCSAEGIIEEPEIRNRYLMEVRQLLGREYPEGRLNHRLNYLRKQKKLPRRGELADG